MSARNPNASGAPGAAAKPPRVRFSITQKLVALIVLSVGAIVLFLSSYFPAQQIQASRAALERKAATYGRLVSKQVASAIAFDDRETAREVFDSVAQDADVESLTLLTAKGETLHSRGDVSGWVDLVKDGVNEQTVVSSGQSILVVSPVRSAEGPRGTLAIELSTRGLEEARAEVTRTAVTAGGLALALGALFAFMIARSLGRRVATVARAADQVAGGDLEQPKVDDRGSDEVAQLAHAFNTMVQQIKQLLAQIKESAQQEQSRLEAQVRARTAELDRRNGDMRLVLDNVGEGFLSVDTSGAMSHERSAVLESWFGPAPESLNFFDYVEQRFPGQGAWFRVSFGELKEDWMPLELRLDQLPSSLEADGRYYGLSYQPIEENGALVKLLVVIMDHTALHEMRRAEEDERELVQVVTRLIADRRGVSEFVAECDRLVDAIASDGGDRAARLRHLHTLKGTCGIFGLTSIVRLCHELETEPAEAGEDLSMLDRMSVRAAWDRVHERLDAFLKDKGDDSIDVPRSEFEAFAAEIEAGAPHARLRAALVRFRLQPAEARLSRVAEHARALSERLGKGPVDVRVESNDVRLDPAAWSDMWQALVHVVRNAVDHGLETPAERKAAGKSESGQLILRTRLHGDVLAIEVEDRGRGIAWDVVAEKAKKHGLPAETQDQLLNVLLNEGFSTRDQATDISGRGVGLAVARRACSQTGGRLTVKSTRSVGTTFRFEWEIDEQGRPLPRTERMTDRPTLTSFRPVSMRAQRMADAE